VRVIIDNDYDIGTRWADTMWEMMLWGRKPVEVIAWVVAILFLGWLLPSIMGVVYTDPLLHLTYAGLTVLFAAPMVVDQVYLDPKSVWRHMQAGVRFAMVSFLLIMAVDALRANRASGGNLWPEPGHVGRVAMVALAFSIFGAGASAALASQVTRAKTARQILRTGFLLLLAASVYGLRSVGGDWRFQLMTMVQPDGGWAMLAGVCLVLTAE
jgi:hypothetical protein